MQLARAHGLKVLGTAGTSEGEKAVKQAGASLVFNHRQDGYYPKHSGEVTLLYYYCDVVTEFLEGFNCSDRVETCNA